MMRGERAKEFLGDWRGYLVGIALVALATWLKYLALPNVIPADVPILYFVVIIPTAIFYGLGPSILVCILSVLAFDYFFIPPVRSVDVTEIFNAPMLLIFLAVGVLFSYLSSNLRRKNQIAIEEIATRKQTEAELTKYKAHLEELVKQRTTGLEKANKNLRDEIAERNKLEQRNSFLSAIVESSDDIIIGKTLEGIITSWNKGAQRIYGYTEAEVIGKSLSMLVPPDHAEEVQCFFDQIKRGGRIQYYETLRVRKDGTIFPVSLTISPILDGRGQIIGASTIAQDITERKKTEEALKESEQRLRLAQDAANAGTWEWDLRTNNNYWSEEIWKLYGLEPHSCEPSYDAWARTIHPDDRPNVVKAVQEAANSGTKLSTEWRVKGRPGNERWLMSIGQPLLDASGKVSRYIGIVIDITERKKLEQMKDEFIGMVSHELKTPITVIMGALYTAVSEGIPEEEIRQLVQDAASSTESLAGIVDNLLELSRFQANRLLVRKQPVDIAQTANKIVQRLKGRSEKHQLVVDAPDGLPNVPADRIRVERILHNLIENAIKYSPDGGNITVFARQEDGNLVVGVKDQGIGISAEDQARLFSPFERLEKSEGVSGFGLGLTVCRRLVEAHGGRIWLESEPSKGTIFYFTLPL